MCIYTYIFRCNVYQCMIYCTSSYRSATIALHNLLSSFKTIPTVAPRLLSINSRAGKTKKPLIQNIGGALRSTDKKRRGKWCSMCVLFQTRYGNLRVPSQCHPPQKIRPYLGMIKGTMMVNNPSIRSSFFGGVALDSHYKTSTSTWFNVTYLYPSWRSRRTFKRVT